MTNSFAGVLESHQFLANRRASSETRLGSLQARLQEDEVVARLGCCLFAAGSLGRLDAGSKSDFDPFIVSSAEVSRLDKFLLYSRLIEINKNLGFPDFSNDGEFLDIHHVDKLSDMLGTRTEDAANILTTRMLLLLESRPLTSIGLYDSYLRQTIGTYFRDRPSHSNFKPLFLLNDLLRFWRTLCLNYEGIRNNPNRPWRKKNINLKFSRKLTVFATILPLVASPSQDEESVLELCKLAPLQRLAGGLDKIGDASLLGPFKVVLDDYAMFLQLKDDDEAESRVASEQHLRENIENAAGRLSAFLFDSLTHKRIDESTRRFLVI